MLGAESNLLQPIRLKNTEATDEPLCCIRTPARSCSILCEPLSTLPHVSAAALMIERMKEIPTTAEAKQPLLKRDPKAWSLPL